MIKFIFRKSQITSLGSYSHHYSRTLIALLLVYLLLDTFSILNSPWLRSSLQSYLFALLIQPQQPMISTLRVHRSGRGCLRMNALNRSLIASKCLRKGVSEGFASSARSIEAVRHLKQMNGGETVSKILGRLIKQ
jgi:hypothetical protein